MLSVKTLIATKYIFNKDFTTKRFLSKFINCKRNNKLVYFLYLVYFLECFILC